MEKKNEFQVKSFHGTVEETEDVKLYKMLGISDERNNELMSEVQKKFIETINAPTGMSQDLEYYTENCRSVNEVAIVALGVGRNIERLKQMANNPLQLLQDI